MSVEIACLNRSSLSPRDLAFQSRAIDIQMARDFIPAWSADRWSALGMDYKLPGGDVPWPVVEYTDLTRLPAGSFWPLTIVDDVPAGELGDHDDEAGLISARWKPNLTDPLDATTGSHEALEMRGDPTCDLWMPGSPTVMYAVEAADAVEADYYGIEVELFGERRWIKVSNFVLPAWWVEGAPGPYDFMHLCNKPQEIRPGGYVITRENGAVKEVFADEAGRAKLAAKREQAWTRAARRMRIEAASGR